MQHDVISLLVPAVHFLEFNDVLQDGFAPLEKFLLLDPRMIPAYVSTASLIALAIQGLIRRRWKISQAPLASGSTLHLGLRAKIKNHLAPHGDTAIAMCKLTRLLVTLTFGGLVIFSAVQHYDARVNWSQVAMGVAAAYAALLAVISVTMPLQATRLWPHPTAVLMTFFGVYAYRDVWPLMTFSLSPMDGAEGWFLWTKVVLSAIAGFVVPLLEPYPCVSADGKDQRTEISPEQTASLLSFWSFQFMQPTIAKASRMPHLSSGDLPPPCDEDYMTSLTKLRARYLDPYEVDRKSVRLHWGIIRAFLPTWILSSSMMTLMVVTELAGPIGTNRLLNYLETGGEDAIVRPWVWLVMMGVGPWLMGVAGELYNYYGSVISVRLRAILTTLVFEHALRIRVKAHVPEMSPSTPSHPSSQLLTVDASSIVAEGEEGPTTTPAAVSEPSTAVPEVDDQSMKAIDAPFANVPTPEKPGMTSNFVGKVNNLVTSDQDNIVRATNGLLEIVLFPLLAVSLAMGFLYLTLGWSAFAGLAAMIVLAPVPGWLGGKMQGIMDRKAKATDDRVGIITETMSVIRMIKLFGWESQLEQDIAAKRNDELRLVWKEKLAQLALELVNHIIPMLHVIVTYATYTLIMKKPISASIIFGSLRAFHMVRNQVFTLSARIPGVLRGNVSLKRLQTFLTETELLDEYLQEKPSKTMGSSAPSRQDCIGFKDAAFSWSNLPAGGTQTPSGRGFRLRIEDELLFKKNAINLIIGPTGSGKTSLLMALLGEMHYIPSKPGSWFSLPRLGGVAYAPQESWVLNTTIRENIVFGSAYHEDRYNKVLQQCALERDLELFDAGDATEVGEKGLTLSGGQKARVTLARAVYSSADILILDDILAALDVHTSRWIVDKCFKGDLIRGRTVLLVTHNVALANHVADYVVALGTDGTILSQGSLSEALAKDQTLAQLSDVGEDPIEATSLFKALESDVVATAKTAKDGKLMLAEEVATGSVGWPAFKLLVDSMGGKWPALFWLLVLSGYALNQVGDTAQVWWLGWWARQYNLHPSSEVNVQFYLGIYSSIVTGAVTVFIFSTVVFTLGTLRASRKIHEALLSSLLQSTFRWLDTTPVSRIIARCTQDIQAVDSSVPSMLGMFLDMSLTLVTKLGTIFLFTPIFLVVGVVFMSSGLWLATFFRKAQLPVKREASNARAPILATMDSVVTGLTSIRAYGAQSMFRDQAWSQIDVQTKVASTQRNLSLWFAMRMNALSSTFVAALGFYLVYGPSEINASNVGFMLAQGSSFTDIIMWWIWVFNMLQVEGNSLERILAYLHIEKEPMPAEGGKPPAYWPSSGEIRVENLSARYSPDGPKVLQDVTFHVRSGERIGIVGRTGSGKSSLTLSLLRCIYTDGVVYYDGIPTNNMRLDALRSKITIIPQVPELLTGTLRRNLDMFNEHEDATLNDALRAAGLFSLQAVADENKLTLDSNISSGGNNLSVGQRQIIALARALVRQSKLLILDEATSAIDYETDAIIQNSLRRELKSDVTVITVAHRLQTIMDSDKVMVLDAGRLVEFASPKELLQNKQSFLRALVEESADKETLYSVVDDK